MRKTGNQKQKANLKERNGVKKTSKQATRKSQKKVKVVTDSDEPADAECLFCTETFLISGGKWIRCEICRGWAHVECADVELASFVCDFCK